MAMTCGRCSFYSADNAETCPKCNDKLRVTFLPPPTMAAPAALLPAPLAVGSPSYPMPGFRGTYDLVEVIFRNRLIAFVIAASLIFMGFWWAGSSLAGSGPAAKYRAIRQGMTVDQVHEILYADSRFSHSSSRVSSRGDSQMSWTEGPIKIVVYFRNGRVIDKRIMGVAYDDDEDWDAGNTQRRR
jgi:hypothetical protein